MECIRVLIADDDQAIRDSLAAVVASDPNLEVIGQAEDAPAAIGLASMQKPDVAILDVRMPGGGGPRATREILRRSPLTRVMAFSASEDADSVLSMLRAGALGYIVKTESPDAIVQAIRHCADEQTTLSGAIAPAVAHALAGNLQQRSRRPARDRGWREQIAGVIEESGLVPVFQPIVDIGCSRVVGVEALARFDTTPRRGPEEWFAEADAVGMLSDLELAAVRAALPSLEELPPDCYLSVNISPGTACSPDLGEELRSTSLDRVVLEVTEHLPVEDYAVLGVALESLRSRGLRLAIDDVGAGFSSLRHIVHLGPDLLKLDVSLIRDLDRDDVRRAVVEALTSFAARIGANVIAEGIETTAELAALQDIGVGFGQGYFLGRPGALVDALMNHSGNEPVAANAARGSS